MKQYRLKLQRIIASGEEEVPQPYWHIAYMESIPGDRIFEYPGEEGYYKILEWVEVLESTNPPVSYENRVDKTAGVFFSCGNFDAINPGHNPKTLSGITFTNFDPFPNSGPVYTSKTLEGRENIYKRVDFESPDNIGPFNANATVFSYKMPDNIVVMNNGEPIKQIKEDNARYYLQKAQEALQQRATLRDRPTGERSMASTVEAFNALTGRDLTESEGWEFMVLLKMVRGRQGKFNADDYVDGAAYFGLLGESNAKLR